MEPNTHFVIPHIFQRKGGWVIVTRRFYGNPDTSHSPILRGFYLDKETADNRAAHLNQFTDEQLQRGFYQDGLNLLEIPQ